MNPQLIWAIPIGFAVIAAMLGAALWTRWLIDLLFPFPSELLPQKRYLTEDMQLGEVDLEEKSD